MGETESDLTIELCEVPINVIANGETVATTHAALRLEEKGHAPVYYLPRNDVIMNQFRQTDRSTRCPRKGTASYYSISTQRGEIENAAWSYEDPIAQAAQIKGYLAFYPEKVEILGGSEE